MQLFLIVSTKLPTGHPEHYLPFHRGVPPGQGSHLPFIYTGLESGHEHLPNF
jgi:hypothetical protein